VKGLVVGSPGTLGPETTPAADRGHSFLGLFSPRRGTNCRRAWNILLLLNAAGAKETKIQEPFPASCEELMKDRDFNYK
jgi:hypothetical protein